MLSTLGVLATEKEKEFKKFEEFRSSRRRRQDPGTERERGDSRLKGAAFGGARLPNNSTASQGCEFSHGSCVVRTKPAPTCPT
jgi:hypothetical protein